MVYTFAERGADILNSFLEPANTATNTFKERWTKFEKSAVPDPSFPVADYLFWLHSSRPEGEPVIPGFPWDAGFRATWVRSRHTSYCDRWGEPELPEPETA
jgi:hypothetical protein